MKPLRKLLLVICSIILLVVLVNLDANAQCAMCRATLENNVSNGEVGIAAGLNTGILYLFAMPYLVVGFISYMWYRRTRGNAETPRYSPR